MADRGHELTDEIIKDLEKRVAEEYRKALADAEKKYANWLKKFTAEDKRQKQLLKDGVITEQDYKNWRFRHLMMGKEWEKMRDALARDFHNANQIAIRIARDRMPDVYALNMNYGTYNIEHGGQIDTGFQLFNHDTAEILMAEEDIQLMPRPSEQRAEEIAANKDLQWNSRHIQSAVLQGVLQGESPYEVARRLQRVAQMNYNNAVRYARTMTTNTQNAGRYEAFRRADKLGVDLTIEWQATLDSRTRHDHRLMHGQRTTVDKPFHTPDGFTIMWPADCTSGSSDAPQSEIWNCRCTLLSWVKGFEGETIKSSPKMGGMTFEEWQQTKAVPDTARDRAQFKEYQRLLGKDAPKYYNDFQQIKYTDAKQWSWLKEQARMERVIRSAPCVLTKQKFSRYFLAPEGKHSTDFFGVGYTQNDARLLRYDMARQFNRDAAIPRGSAYGIEAFSVIMTLGVDKQGRFITGWQVDKEGALPRIITGFRREE